MPGEPLWSLRKDGRQITCELRSHGEYGWEAQLFRDGEFYAPTLPGATSG
jgi:hypothetical protein